MKLSAKLGLSIALPCVLSCLVVGLLGIFRGASAISLATDESLLLKIQNTALKITSMISSVELVNQRFDSFIVPDTVPGKDAGFRLAGFPVFAESFDGLVNARGVALVSGGLSLGDRIVFADEIGSSYLPRLSGGREADIVAFIEEVIQSPLFRKMNGDPYWLLSGKIGKASAYCVQGRYDVSGKMYAVGFCRVSPEMVNKVVAGLHAFRSGYGFLLDASFAYLAHPTLSPGTSFVLSDEAASRSLRDMMVMRESGIKVATVDGVRTCLTFSRLPNGWILVLSVPADEVLSGVRSISVSISVFMFIGILASLLFAILLPGILIKPILAVTEASRSLAKGVLEFYVEPETEDETGEMIRSLNMATAIMKGKVDELEVAKQEISDIAFTNKTSGLPNRNALFRHFSRYAEGARLRNLKFGMMFLDIDDFKKINNTLGYKAGDRYLAFLGERLKEMAGPGARVFHFSGDEYLVMKEFSGDNITLRPLVQNIFTMFDEPYRTVEGSVYFITASAGIVIWPDHGEDLDILVKRANIAMDSVKRNQTHDFSMFDDSMEGLIRSELVLENEIREAVRNSEFEVHYQPKVSCGTGLVVAAEALARWRRTDGTMRPPGMFISFAEEHGLIGEIGEMIFTKTCEQIAAWKGQGVCGIRVSVNVSQKDLMTPAFVPAVRRIIGETGVSPDCLEFEVTESILMDDFEHGIRVLDALRETGFNIALDDFGTGYSSLSYMLRLPINTIKLDKSFIDNMLDSDRNRHVVASMIGLAHGTGLMVVAEGVERKDQADALVALGCDEIQGFYYSKPLPAADFMAYMTSWNRKGSSGA